MSARVIDGESTIGGGSAPGSMLPTRLVVIEHASANELDAALRAGRTPVVARIESDRIVLDLRTVDPGQDTALGELVMAAAG